MILQTANLSPAGSKFSGEETNEIFEWPADGSAIVHPSGPLRWKFTAKLFGDELLIEGKVSAEFSGVCARCGCDMVFEIAEPLCFSVEISEEIAEVDLTSELRDAILLALPNHPVCKTDCQGVCPTCGKPLSEGSCTCGSIKNTSPWDTLDGLG